MADTKSLNIELDYINNEEVLKFKFKGNFSEADAGRGVKEWKNLFSSMNGEKAKLVWDATKMTSYDSKARTIWQQGIKELKNQIDTIWLISHSKLIRSGAKAMSLFTKFKIYVVETDGQIGNY